MLLHGCGFTTPITCHRITQQARSIVILMQTGIDCRLKGNGSISREREQRRRFRAMRRIILQATVDSCTRERTRLWSSIACIARTIRERQRRLAGKLCESMESEGCAWECVGMVLGLVWDVSDRVRNGLSGIDYRLVPGVAGRQLDAATRTDCRSALRD